MKVRQKQIKLFCSRLCKLVSPKPRNSHGLPSSFILCLLPMYSSTWSVLWNIKGEREFSPIMLLTFRSFLSGFMDCTERDHLSHNCLLLGSYISVALHFFLWVKKSYELIFCTYEKPVRNKIILSTLSRNQVTVGLILVVIFVQNSWAV